MNMTPEELAPIIATQTFLVKKLPKDTVGKIVQAFRAGKVLRELASIFLSDHEQGVAVGAINKLLKEEIPVEEYEILARGKGAKTQIHEKIGIHSHDQKQKAASGKLGADASGGNVYTEDEENELRFLLENPEYKRGTRVNAEKIAHRLNALFHGNELVRTSENLRQKISRLRKKTSEKVSEVLLVE